MKGYHYIKRGIDIILSGMAIVILSPLLLFLCIAIKLDTPGPILFKQKRVGIHRSFFQIYKFRTMRIDTPKDVPTHMLENPEQYITKVGKFLRKTSLDELPQIFNIFKGEMSIVGPRPALWNQDDLVAEREKYGANDVTPGLTGWAQINGRDELEIPDKARLDGEYVKHLGPWMDLKCFLGTIGSVLMHDGVVEGGTGEEGQQRGQQHPRSHLEDEVEMLSSGPERSRRKRHSHHGHKRDKKVHGEPYPDHQAGFPISPDLSETIIEDVGHRKYQHSARQGYLPDGEDFRGKEIRRDKADREKHGHQHKGW